MLKPVKGGFVGDYEYENEGTGKEQDTSGMAKIRLGSGEKEQGYKIPKREENIKNHLEKAVNELRSAQILLEDPNKDYEMYDKLDDLMCKVQDVIEDFK